MSLTTKTENNCINYVNINHDSWTLAIAGDDKKKENILLNTLKMVTTTFDGAKQECDLSFHKRLDSSQPSNKFTSVFVHHIFMQKYRELVVYPPFC